MSFCNSISYRRYHRQPEITPCHPSLVQIFNTSDLQYRGNKNSLQFQRRIRSRVSMGYVLKTRRDQSCSKNNGDAVCIDESLLPTLCGSNVIPVTPPMTTKRRKRTSWRAESGPGAALQPRGTVILNGRNEGAVDEGATTPPCRTIYHHLFNWFVKVPATNASR